MRNVSIKVLAICVILSCLIGCNKSKSAVLTDSGQSTSTSKKTAISQKDPIVIDWKDFEFTKGYDVPGTIFQADFIWYSQEGKSVTVRIEGTLTGLIFQNAPQLYNFKYDDPVTVVFKVTSSSMQDIVSINPR